MKTYKVGAGGGGVNATVISGFIAVLMEQVDDLLGCRGGYITSFFS